MKDNKTINWSYGLYHVQWAMNTTVSEATKCSPYEAVFELIPKIGLATKIPLDLLTNINNGVMEEEFNQHVEDSTRMAQNVNERTEDSPVPEPDYVSLQNIIVNPDTESPVPETDNENLEAIILNADIVM